MITSIFSEACLSSNKYLNFNVKRYTLEKVKGRGFRSKIKMGKAGRGHRVNNYTRPNVLFLVLTTLKGLFSYSFESGG